MAKSEKQQVKEYIRDLRKKRIKVPDIKAERVDKNYAACIAALSAKLENNK